MWIRACLAALALAAGCSSTPDTAIVPADSGRPAPPSAGAGATRPADGLQVGVALSQDTVRQGETVRVAVTVTNRGPTPRTIEATSACFTDFELLDASGAVVATADQLCAAVMSQRTLAPGESFTESSTWSHGVRGMPSVPPGDYRVRGVLLATSGRVTSEAVPVTVR